MGEIARFGDREREVLEFAAVHQLVSGRQVAALLGERAGEADELLAGLTSGGLLVRDRIGRDEASFRISRAGLRAVGSRRSPPGFEWHNRTAVGAAWLWLHARGGTLGAADRVLSELEMRAEDHAGGAGAPCFVEPHEFGGRPGVHYPDLVMMLGSDRRPVELLLALPARRQLEAVLRAYAADVRVRDVICVVVDPWVARAVQAIVSSLELLPMVTIQPVLAWWRSRATVD